MISFRPRRLLPFLLLLLMACRQAESPAPVVADLAMGSLTIPITAPVELPAGDPLPITIGPFLPDEAESAVDLVFLGSYGPQVYTVPLYYGWGNLTIASDKTQLSGSYTLIASAGEARGEATLLVTPHEAVEPLTPLIGARSIIADGEHWAMVVLIPFDKFGNPVVDGTPVQVRALHPNGALESDMVPTEHLLAWDRLYSTTTAGRTEVSAQIGQIFGHEGLLLEVPGWPVPFRLTSDTLTAPADGFQYVTIRTSVIADQYGNIMPDGTQINFLVEGASGDRRSMPSFTIDGVAEVIMQTPVEPGEVTVAGSVFGVASEPLTLAFTPGPAVGFIPVALRLNPATGSLTITAGPVLGQLNQYVPDGTRVEFRFTGPDGVPFTELAQVDAGYAELVLRLAELAPGTYELVLVAGAGYGGIHFEVPGE
ncbi:MAG: hypothetical protein KDE34_06955 [Anaerolineales bacterium]|nr:hypothetical protein [Anaerolineales bacterium]